MGISLWIKVLEDVNQWLQPGLHDYNSNKYYEISQVKTYSKYNFPEIN